MLLGVDFDNTIVCYDQVFRQVALEQGLIPPEVPVSKGEVRDYLRQCDREDDWTELQGYVYGTRMQDATPFPGVLECLTRLVRHSIMVCIISHKTRYPYMGPKYDLHQAAQQWLEQQGFFDPAQIGLSPDQVFFELTKQGKLDRIAKVGCTHFVDDLPEFLAEPGLPPGVERILFDPNGNYPTGHRFHRITSWMEIEEIIIPLDERLAMSPERFRQAVANLVAEAGFCGDFSLHPLTGGANNRVFRVEVNGSRALLKAYFQHADDPRDRLGAEFSFSRFAWKNGLRCLPQPLACDYENRLGLYEFVQGRQLLPHEVKENAVRQALDFYRELNRHKRLPAAQALPESSEAGFSIADHLRRVELRVQRLNGVDESSEINRQAAHFIRNELSEAWGDVADSVRQRADELGLALDTEIVWQDRCLSPSDFGFHNAILSDDGRLRFIDFEYAGWDDPAKTVGDFFCQPALPVSLDYYDMFVEEVTALLLRPEMHRQRIALLLPVYQIKWCCILLNDLLPVGSQRRRFAGSPVNQEEQKARQLRKARHALRNLIPWGG